MKREGNHSPCQLQAYPMSQMQQIYVPNRSRDQYVLPRKRKLGKKLDPLPKSYGQLPQHFLKDTLVKLKSFELPPCRYPTSHDENARYKRKVQDLIDKQLTFNKCFLNSVGSTNKLALRINRLYYFFVARLYLF